MLNLIFLYVFLILKIFNGIQSEEFWVKLGDKIEICCNIQFNEKNSLVLFQKSLRLTSLYNNSLNDGDWVIFAAEYNSFVRHLKNNTICVSKDQTTKKENNLTFMCSVVKNIFGPTLKSETLSIKIYEELKFIDSLSNLTTVANGGNISVKCDSTGSPDLRTVWQKQKGEVLVTGTDSATLFIQNVSLSMNGDSYTCTASIGVPNDTPNSSIQQITTLDIQFKPIILYSLKSFQTDLGINEIVEITVQGNPVPTLNCRQMAIEADTVKTISDPRPHVYLYQIIFNNITMKHIGSYECTAENKIGSTKEMINLILGPINLLLISPNVTSFANYYKLEWQVDSKSKVNVSKIFIDKYNTTVDSASTTQRVLQGKDLSPIVTQAGSDKNNWRYIFSQHVMDLWSNTWYRISLQMCTKYQCIDTTNPVYFQTPAYNGKNNMTFGDLVVAQNIITSKPGGESISLVPLKHLCVMLAVLNIVSLH